MNDKSVSDKKNKEIITKLRRMRTRFSLSKKIRNFE